VTIESTSSLPHVLAHLLGLSTFHPGGVVRW
jgi:hypothetical protein